MPLLTKTQKRTTISALRSSNVRAINREYIIPYTIRAKHGRAYRYRADLDKLDQLGN